MIDEVKRILANSEDALYKAQIEYEKAVEGRIIAREEAAKAQLDYEYLFSEKVAEKADTGKITIVKELAKRECFDLYRKWQMAEINKKKFENLADKFEQRLNTIKAIMKINTTR